MGQNKEYNRGQLKSDDKKLMFPTSYQQLLGSLMYQLLADQTTDIAFAKFNNCYTNERCQRQAATI